MKEFIERLRDKNVYLEVINNELIIDAPEDILDPAMINELKEKKVDIIHFLESQDKNARDLFSIKKTLIKESYPLSNAQKSFWLMHQFNEKAILNNQSTYIFSKVRFSQDRLTNTLRYLINRHEVLRTVFKRNLNDEAAQYIIETDQFPLEVNSIDLGKENDKEEQLKLFLKDDLHKPFNLAEGPLFRVTTYLFDDQVLLSFTIHHIINDRWSMALFYSEFTEVYGNYVKGENPNLASKRIQYKDFSEWEKRCHTEVEKSIAKDFFMQQFSLDLPVLELPVDKKRPIQKSHLGKEVTKTIKKELLDEFKSLATKNEGTLYIGLLSIVKILLNKYTNQTDIAVGFPVSGRDNIELEDQQGVFMKTLGIRTQFTDEDNFGSIFKKIKDLFYKTLQYSFYSFDDLLIEMNVQSNVRRRSLFDVIVVLQNQNVEKYKTEEMNLLNEVSHNDVISIVDLEFYFVESDNGLLFNIVYNQDIFNHETIVQLSNHFEQILKKVVEKPDQPIKIIDYLSDKEKKKLLLEFNNKTKLYSNTSNFIELFEERVNLMPDGRALIYGDEVLTYNDLNIRSTKISKIINQLIIN